MTFLEKKLKKKFLAQQKKTKTETNWKHSVSAAVISVPIKHKYKNIEFAAKSFLLIFSVFARKLASKTRKNLLHSLFKYRAKLRIIQGQLSTAGYSENDFILFCYFQSCDTYKSYKYFDLVQWYFHNSFSEFYNYMFTNENIDEIEQFCIADKCGHQLMEEATFSRRKKEIKAEKEKVEDGFFKF